jgi:hypothetical protein
MEPLRLQRILSPLGEAARSNRIFHLNWHPHNFGVDLEANLAVLRAILVRFAQYRQSHGMRSLAMKDAVEVLKGTGVHAGQAA